MSRVFYRALSTFFHLLFFLLDVGHLPLAFTFVAETCSRAFYNRPPGLKFSIASMNGALMRIYYCRAVWRGWERKGKEWCSYAAKRLVKDIAD